MQVQPLSSLGLPVRRRRPHRQMRVHRGGPSVGRRTTALCRIIDRSLRVVRTTAGAWPLLCGIDVDGEIDSGLPVAILDAQTEREIPGRGGVPQNSAGACIEA
jgi:hypothetical protein